MPEPKPIPATTQPAKVAVIQFTPLQSRLKELLQITREGMCTNDPRWQKAHELAVAALDEAFKG